MRNWIVLGITTLAACGSNGSGTNIMCGDGTTLVGSTCEAGSGSSGGSGDTCGTGTHEDGTMCVPDSPAATGAPTITTIDPPDAGFTGSVLFQITGTGFAGADITDLHVFFGDTGDMNCEAEVAAADATTIGGEVPFFCADLNVVVTVQTNKGSATTPFHYDALFAADGDGGGTFGAAGDLYIIDPFAELSFDLGPLSDAAATNTYGMSGIAFDSTGVLWGVTTGDSPGDPTLVSQLVTIDPGTATVTVIGNTVAGNGKKYLVSDIKMSGTTLYGWAYSLNNAGTAFVNQSLVTINATTGVVTPLGAVAHTQSEGGLAIDGTGNLFVAANGAAADTTVTPNTTGELGSVAAATGVVTSMATLDYLNDGVDPGGVGAPIEAMTYVGANLVAVVDNGLYGLEVAPQGTAPTIFGERLALIDPAAVSPDPIVSVLFELPAQIGSTSRIDAMDMAPAAASLARRIPHGAVTALKHVGDLPRR